MSVGTKMIVSNTLKLRAVAISLNHEITTYCHMKEDFWAHIDGNPHFTSEIFLSSLYFGDQIII